MIQSAGAAGGITNQGAYMTWNLSTARGETDFINQQGLGSGGWNWYNYNNSNQLTANAAYLSSTGGLTLGTYSNAYTAPSGGLICPGNVGIGTASPQAPLHIYKGGSGGTESIMGEIRVCSDDGNISRVGCYEESGGTTWGGWFQYNGANAQEGQDQLQIGGKRNGTNVTYINIGSDSGNVGIGYGPSSTYKLAINGNVLVQGSVVPTGAGGVATNTAVGASAMNANTTGIGNTAVGASALPNNTTGVYNTAAGWQAMCLNTTGSYNTAVGTSALYQNTTGGGNTAVGYQAMVSNSTGQNNVCLGYNSGFDALVTITTQSNYVVLGNNSTATLYCKTSAINTSDARDKTNVESIAVGLDYVRKLKPVTFNFDDRGWYPEGQAPDGSKACSIHRLGFLAQDILAAEQELGLPFNHVVNTDFPEKLGIMPTNLIPILVKAIQELEQSLATATANISSLEQSLATVTANISSLQPPSAPANPQSSP